MDIYIFNKNLEFIDNIDTAISVIIAPKYYGCGDFEIYMSASLFNSNSLAIENYIAYGDFFGIIESIKIETDAENGSHVTVAGRNIESILDRRIVMTQTVYSGTVEGYIRRLLNENCINPSDVNRKISNIALGPQKGFTELIEIQCTYDNLLEHIIQICKAYRIGFRMLFHEKSKKFVFELYRGTDRSVSSGIESPITFSKGYDNLLSTEYYCDFSTIKNVAIVAGEGEGNKRVKVTVGSAKGLSRREQFVDARELSTNDGEIPASEYVNQLKEKGNAALSVKNETVDGAIVQNQFLYGVDFFTGDIVTIKNEYGMTFDSRVVEVDIVEDESGFRINPIFDKEGDDND